MARVADFPLAALGLLWPAIAAEQTSEFATAVAQGFLDLAGDLNGEPLGLEPGWVTPNEIVLELESVTLARLWHVRKGTTHPGLCAVRAARCHDHRYRARLQFD